MEAGSEDGTEDWMGQATAGTRENPQMSRKH